jgi:hypothetical protein
MKKSTLALSIAAALGGLGMAGNALAVKSFTPATGGNDVIAVNPDGHGHKLLFPYFTVQNGNATLLTITNTNTAVGKLVKVRFRGAGNSDDLYDFQVALSPGDIWTAAVTQHSSGAAQLSTADNSCTVPAKSNFGAFNTDRVDGRDVAQTREGYVEVINMADIPSATGTSSLFKNIKHVSGVAPCVASELLTLLGTDDTAANLKSARGMSEPTTGLTGDWIIINQNTTAAWSGSATALEVRTSAGAATTGNIVFWPQTLGTPDGWTAGTTTTMTADPLLTAALVSIQNYDLPDMSTAYVNNAATDTAAEQADVTSAALAVRSIRNQYATESSINGVTDILFSQPMRRYAAAVNYKSTTVTDSNGNTLVVPFSTAGTRAQPIYRGHATGGLTSTTISNVVYLVATTSAALTTAIGDGNAYYGPTSNAKNSTTKASNLAIPSGQRNLCLYSINGAGTNTIWDREETTPGASSSSSTSFVISPSTPTTTTTSVVTVCGEAAVISINNGAAATRSGALSASLALSDMSASSLTAYQAGWVVFNTGAGANNVVNPDNQNGLPILGGSFLRAANGPVNYGFHYTNKVTR